MADVGPDATGDAISATATAIPPSLRSWQLRTSRTDGSMHRREHLRRCSTSGVAACHLSVRDQVQVRAAEFVLVVPTR